MFSLTLMLCLGLLWCLAHDSMAGQISFQEAEAAFRGPTSMHVLAALSLVLWAGLGMFKKDRASESETSQSRQTEEALRRSEEQFRGLVENIPGIIYRCELEPPWRMEHISEESLSLTGHRAEEFMSGEVAWADLVVEEDLAGLSRLVAESVERHESYMMEYRIRHRDGGIHWVNEKGRAVYDQEGRPLWLNGMILDITQRKQAEEALKASEANYREIFNASNDAVFVHQAETGEILDVNQTMCVMYGYSYEEACQLTVADISQGIPPYSQPEAGEKVRRALEEGPQLFEWHAKKKNGELFWVEVNLRRAIIGGEVRVVAVVRDISERKQFTEALLQSQKNLAQAQKMAHLGSWVWNVQSGEVSWSPEVYKLFGVSRDNFDPKIDSVIARFHPEDRWLYQQVMKRASEGKGQFSFEARVPHPDGTMRYLASTAEGSFDREGGLQRIAGTVQDITERKQYEESLKQAEQRLGAILDATPLTITITRKSDGKYRHVNKAFSRQFGFTWDEAIGKTPFELNMFVDPGDRQRFLDILDREGKVVDYEMQYRRKDGTIIDVVLFMEQMVLDGEDCLIVTVTDVTERKRAEEERFEYEAQRRQSQKMEAIGTLAGGVAHDFNNILAAMMGYTEITMEDLPDGGLAAENLKQVLKAGYRAKNLVHQILSFSRQSEQEHVPAELGPIVKEAVKLIRASIPSTIEIEQSLDEQGARVLADPIQVHQLVMNLCTNSAQAMPEGGLLQVELRPVNLETARQSPDLPPGRYLRLMVKDSGQGMDEQTLLRIFDPFFTTKEVDQGTGMGLAVVHGIVEGHGGAITVESSPNQGAAFRVFFPVLEGDAAAAPPAGQAEMPTGDERILLVDDEETLAELGGKTLERLGYSVKTFTSSPQALEYFQAHPDEFDLVISDYTMPQMTGVRLAQEMLRTRPGLPIIITTGFSQQLSEEKAGTLGIRRVLLKPLSGNRLARIIREVLGETRSA